MRGVVHCFTGTPDEARVFVEEFDLYLGIGGVLTFPNARALREAVGVAGAQHLVLETDCPYLAPVPMRGKRNEPSFVIHTAAKLSEVLGIPLDRDRRGKPTQTPLRCSGSRRFKIARGAPFEFEPGANGGGDLRVAGANAPIGHIPRTAGVGRVGRPEPRAIAGDCQFCGVVADAHADAVVDQVFENGTFARAAAQGRPR